MGGITVDIKITQIQYKKPCQGNSDMKLSDLNTGRKNYLNGNLQTCGANVIISITITFISTTVSVMTITDHAHCC